MKLRHALLVAMFLAVGLSAAVARSGNHRTPATMPGPGEPSLAEVRLATERFRDVKVALAEGYIRD